jgi:hypothetical protein
MQPRQRGERSPAFGGQRRLVPEPEIAAALELWPALALGAANLVDGVVDELDGVELVEGDLGFGQVLRDALDEGAAHVDAHLFDAGGVAVVGLEIVGELTNGVGATSFRDEQRTSLIDVDEQPDVVVAALGGGLVDADALHVIVVGPRTRLLDPMVQHAPHPGVVLFHQSRCGGDWHGRHQRHGERLEQQREAGARPGPRHGDLLDAAVGTGDARRPGMQERLMLEEVEVPPGLQYSVVHGTVGRGALRARETSTSGEVDLDVETARFSIEVGRLDHPRRHEPESELQKVGVAHGRSPPGSPRSCRRARGRQDQAFGGPEGRS